MQTIDFIDFTLDAATGYSVSTLEIDVTSTPNSNFSEVIALYSNGSLITTASVVKGGENTASIVLSDLADGTYTLGVAGWIANFTQDIANANSTACFNNGSFSGGIETTISAVPLPAGRLLLLSGFGILTIARRKKKAA